MQMFILQEEIESGNIQAVEIYQTDSIGLNRTAMINGQC